MDDRRDSFFRGSEFTRFALLAAICAAGWFAFARLMNRPGPAAPPEAPLKAESAPPPPIEPDRAAEFETVTDRTPMSFRDNAAYGLLLEKARERSPSELARESRRDVFLTHLWERPEQYRGVPVHLAGTALRVVRFESKMSKTGWLYEAWIVTPDARRFPYDCVFEEPPEGLPIGTDVSERVVFNGYFLKVMKYQAGDQSRGAPVLVGRIGWEERREEPPAKQSNRILYWSLLAIASMFVLTMFRWIGRLVQLFSLPRRPGEARAVSDEIRPDALQAWVESQGEPEPDEPSDDRGSR